MVRLEVTDGSSLTRKLKGSLCCLLAKATWQINEQTVNISHQVHLLCPWARQLTGLPLPLMVKWAVSSGSLT